MFIYVKFVDHDGNDCIEPLNVMHIIRVSFLDMKNVDAGVKFHMRNGDVLPSPEPMDIVGPKMNEAWTEACMIVLTQLSLDMAEKEMSKELPKTKPKRKRKNNERN